MKNWNSYLFVVAALIIWASVAQAQKPQPPIETTYDDEDAGTRRLIITSWGSAKRTSYGYLIKGAVIKVYDEEQEKGRRVVKGTVQAPRVSSQPTYVQPRPTYIQPRSAPVYRR